jgi:hypothetical protein
MVYLHKLIIAKLQSYIYIFSEPSDEIEKSSNVSEYLRHLYYKFAGLSLLFQARLRVKRDRNRIVWLCIRK